jgi:hypothetical protein
MFACLSTLVAHAENPLLRVSIHVVGEDGLPITNSLVCILTSADSMGAWHAQRERAEFRDGLTDSNGMVTLTIPSKYGDVAYRVHPSDGDYAHAMRLGDGRAYYADQLVRTRMDKVADGRWEPWNKNFTIVAKLQQNPHAMYARNLGLKIPPLKIPEFGKPIGFDLIKSDWVAPYGKGETSDFIFWYKANDSIGVPKEYYDEYPRSGRYKDSDFKLSFANDGDGLQCVMDNPLSGGSILRLPRCAPESGYESNLVRSCRATWTNNTFNFTGEQWNENQNYIFRVRSQRDQNGTITNALYGKIRGPISFSSGGGGVSFTYYLNPTPNNRKLEYDANHNLLKDILGYRENPPPGP